MAKPITKSTLAKQKQSRKNTVLQVRIYGTYHSKNKKEIKKYECVAKMPIAELEENPVYYVKKHLLPRVGPALYEDWGRHREIYVELADQNEATDNTPIDLLDRDGLIAYIDDENLPVKENLFLEKSSLLQAIKDCIDNEAAFLEYQDSINEKDLEEIKRKENLLELNADLLKPGKTAKKDQIHLEAI